MQSAPTTIATFNLRILILFLKIPILLFLFIPQSLYHAIRTFKKRLISNLHLKIKKKSEFRVCIMQFWGKKVTIFFYSVTAFFIPLG